LFKTLPGIAGSAILGNGRVALILDVPGLVQQRVHQEEAFVAARRYGATPWAVRPRRMS
jgi:chemotaxis protein histidine kinase CheA